MISCDVQAELPGASKTIVVHLSHVVLTQINGSGLTVIRP